MTQKCDGTERHYHYRMSTGSYITHVHTHDVWPEHQNVLHHHPAIEHADFNLNELTGTVVDTGIGLGENIDVIS
jgi:hypothetical protein